MSKSVVYHSHIVAMDDGAKVMFTGKPKDSKFPDNAGFTFFKTQEDGDTEFMFQIENYVVRATLESAPINQWVTMRAFGTKEGATIDIATDALPTEPDAATDSLPTNGAPPTEWPDEKPDAVQATLENQAGLTPWGARMLGSMLEARELEKEFLKRTGTPLTDQIRATGISLFIQGSR